MGASPGHTSEDWRPIVGEQNEDEDRTLRRAVVDVISDGRLPILSWEPELEPGARRQAVDCANLPCAFHHVAVMADGHPGYGVPIGAILALDQAIAPYAVGNDIGCGMALVPTDLTRDQLLPPPSGPSGRRGGVARDEVMGWVQRSVPIDSATRPSDGGPQLIGLLDAAFDALDEASAATGIRLSTTQSEDAGRGASLTSTQFRSRGCSQLGTLGAGNHFIELLSGPDDDVWVLVHSGSRGIGGLVCANFHRMALGHCAAMGAELPDRGLAWLPLPDHIGSHDDPWSIAGCCYERALGIALNFAEMNRQRMLDRVGEELERRFGGCMRWDETVNIHHNDATREDHYGRRVWVHRKGAVKAPAGAPTITPGSMGTGSILGSGLGNPASFSSCAHGAGRRLSRGRARRELDLGQQLGVVADAGGKLFAARTSEVIDEMPDAYKDLDQVMANQADLVVPVKRFRPLATYKGADSRGRSRRSRRSMRLDEEG
jgi:tRNA-splicing ligase RtcB (3'-phosphate/5'-hydroxy nucleic acid ligase)